MNDVTFCIAKLFNIYSDEFTGQSYDGNVYNPDFLCPALRASIGGGIPRILIGESYNG